MVKTTIIVPAYNEEKSIGEVLDNISKLADMDYEIVVVDDGSKDRTYEIAKRFNVRIVRHEKNRGKGAAMMSGVREIAGDYVVFIDADNTYPPENIAKIVENLDSGYDMVVGSRISSLEGMGKVNRIGNKLFGLALKLIYRSKTSDPFSGLYGIKKKHLINMDIVSQGFEIETEIAIKSARMNLNILDIPIRYGGRLGATKLNPLRDGYQILRTILNFMMLYNPMMLFTVPGTVMLVFGLGLMLILSGGGLKVATFWFSYHSLVFASLLSILGFQLIVTGMSSKMYAVLHKFSILDPATRFFIKYKLVNAMKILGFFSFLLGFYMGLRIVESWVGTEFGAIMHLKDAIIAATLMILGIQAIFSSLFLTIFANELSRIEK